MGVLQCTQVLPTECKRKLLHWHHQPSRLRLLLHQKENTLYGSEDLFLLLFPLSNKCGLPNKNTMNVAHPSSTENVSKSMSLLSFYDEFRIQLLVSNYNIKLHFCRNVN